VHRDSGVSGRMSEDDIGTGQRDDIGGHEGTDEGAMCPADVSRKIGLSR
jgi:hypothetical protein